MKRSREFQIFSIFGQIEKAVADSMLEEHLVIKIPQEDIPPGCPLYNKAGEKAYYAIMLPTREMAAIFHRRVRNLRS